jgi:hypothetical protein
LAFLLVEVVFLTGIIDCLRMICGFDDYGVLNIVWFGISFQFYFVVGGPRGFRGGSAPYDGNYVLVGVPPPLRR